MCFYNLTETQELAGAVDQRNDGASKENLHFDNEGSQVVFLFFHCSVL